VLGWQEGEFPELDLSIRCGEGTYIRAIARDLGDLLGVGATLAGLIRTESGGMDLENSLTLEEVAERVESQDFALISPQTVLTDLPKIILDAETAQRWCQGQKIIVTEGKERLNQSLRVLKEDENLLGIGEIVEIETIQRLMPKVVLL
jgi:tRNA pseudouridine55 synthase